MQQLIQLSAVCGLYYIIIILYYLPPANLCEAGIVLSDVYVRVLYRVLFRSLLAESSSLIKIIFFPRKIRYGKIQGPLIIF